MPRPLAASSSKIQTLPGTTLSQTSEPGGRTIGKKRGHEIEQPTSANKTYDSNASKHNVSISTLCASPETQIINMQYIEHDTRLKYMKEEHELKIEKHKAEMLILQLRSEIEQHRLDQLRY